MKAHPIEYLGSRIDRATDWLLEWLLRPQVDRNANRICTALLLFAAIFFFAVSAIAFIDGCITEVAR